ncbi:D-ala-D-ala transporter subunit; membrane component of ABC superfamily [Bradyrhizobium sp. ORS 375]|uniref:ABC transporter permease n=1 Tax=Bradyrhizobium sp. (strain ORS 375) TaxID=566679 RepID=UPI0002407AD1|nr:ABC transporter permease [Bradyrhizobium sp. ORS 375]CCD95715.1 D-ala-D-ala transporter subunit; membrane component of ABC superfamily [Bradyrhizobium sp. ORS 375]
MQPSSSIVSHAARIVTLNWLSVAAVATVTILLLLAVFGPMLAPFDPYATDLGHVLLPPSRTHWFGTDQLGRDVLSRVIVSARLDLFIAVCAVTASFAIGVSIGGLSGYLGGAFDLWTSRIAEMLQVFPLFVLAMALVAALGNDLRNVILATAIVNLPFYVRLARVEVGVLSSQLFVEAARVAGNGDGRIIARVLLPNVMPNLMIQLSVNLGWAILNAASLSFIGLGIRPPTAEWGIMVADGAAQAMAGNWWLVVFPGVALALAVFAFNLLGDALRDILDVRSR